MWPQLVLAITLLLLHTTYNVIYVAQLDQGELGVKASITLVTVTGAHPQARSLARGLTPSW